MPNPVALKQNDQVRIISTARKIESRLIKNALALLESWGLHGSLGENTLSQEHQFAGTTEQRVADLQDALNDSDIRMIWCSRGGYGTVSLLDSIDFSSFLKHPKWIVGYSDITGLLCHLHRMKVPSVHGPMPVNLPDDTTRITSDLKNLKKWLFGKPLSYTLNSHPLNRKGDCSGVVVGGNLSLIYSTLGSSTSINTTGKILFLEDLDEYLYHIDRMMLNLKRNGLLTRLSGLLVGGMTKMNDNDVPFGKSAEEIVADHVREFKYPVYFGVPSGHCSPNQPLPIGVPADIKNNHLTFLPL